MSNCVTDCSCEDQLKHTVLTLSQDAPESVIYQTSLMSALLSGVYDGNVRIADLLRKGDFGLGTFNQLDGEMIAFDSKVYQLHADGSAHPADPAQKTPFAVMTFFRPQHRFEFDRPMSREEIHRVIDSEITSDNQFCALRISGRFSRVDTRTVPCQCRPYRSMPEVLGDQPTFSFSQRAGELIGFRTPQYMQGINVAGYHEHFITDDREGGGHILDYALEQGTLTFGAISKLVVDLPQDSDFLNADLNPANLDAAIRAVES